MRLPSTAKIISVPRAVLRKIARQFRHHHHWWPAEPAGWICVTCHAYRRSFDDFDDKDSQLRQSHAARWKYGDFEFAHGTEGAADLSEPRARG